MQPTVEFKNQLFGAHRDRIRECFFGHVVNEEALLPLAIAKGPTGTRFLFNFANRDSKLLVSSCHMLAAPLISPERVYSLSNIV